MIWLSRICSMVLQTSDASELGSNFWSWLCSLSCGWVHVSSLIVLYHAVKTVG